MDHTIRDETGRYYLLDRSLIFFVQACANGDLEELQEILTTAQSYYNLDLNCKDQNGKSALVVALETENWACLELLLDNGVKIGDALLYAIKNKQVNAVKILFQKMRPGLGISRQVGLGKPKFNG